MHSVVMNRRDFVKGTVASGIVCAGWQTRNQGGHAEVELIKRYKDAGFKVIYRALHTTTAELLEAEDAGADIVIASGWGQGGCNTMYKISLASMLNECKPLISIPLMASGCMAGHARGQHRRPVRERERCRERHHERQDLPGNRQRDWFRLGVRPQHVTSRGPGVRRRLLQATPPHSPTPANPPAPPWPPCIPQYDGPWGSSCPFDIPDTVESQPARRR